MTYAETKQSKLKRKPVLRIMNAIGMVAWRDDRYGEAKQHLRLIHPVTWIWLIVMILVGIVIQGIPETYKDIKYSLTHDTLWF
jgi:hypothetical protein